MPGVKKVVKEFLPRLAQRLSSSPNAPGMSLMRRSKNSFMRRKKGEVTRRDRMEERAPTFWEMDMSLSFRITVMRRFLVSGLVQGLEGQARRERAVADDRHHVVVVPGQVAGHGHAQGGGDGGGGMAHAEVVVGRLGHAREAGDAVHLAQGVEAGVAAGEELVGIGLMPHVPDQAVAGQVQGLHQGQGQLDGAQVGGQVAAGL